MKGRFHTLTLALLLGAVPVLQAAEAPAQPDAGAAQATPAETLSPQEATLEALKQAPLKGEKLELNAAGKPFFALYMPGRGTPKGGILLLHDAGEHPDTPGVIHPLRTRLPEFGWSTLSITLPPHEDATATPEWLDQSQGRIAAAINTLQQRGADTIVLAGHGLGAMAASDYLAAGDNLSVRGLIVIGMDGSRNEDPRLDGAESLARVRPPILDIFGGHDRNRVLASATRRAAAAERRTAGEGSEQKTYRDIARDYSEKKGDKVGYRQLRIAAAGHDFSSQEELLVRRVRGWLRRYIAGK